MGPTISGMARGVQRTAAQMAWRIPDRFRNQGRTGTGRGDVILPEGQTPPVRDPSMDPFAEMFLKIGSSFPAGYLSIPSLYDRAAHKYRQDYIQRSSLTLWLSAEPGLERYESTLIPDTSPSPRVNTAAGASRRIETVQELQAHLDEQEKVMIGPSDQGWDGDGSVQPGDPRRVPPAYLLAYDWVVSHDGTTWSKHLILQNPKASDVLTRLALDGPGKYTVRMRVYFTDNRMSEKKVKFSVQEKFLVGLGDSYASGEGNPDRRGEVQDGGGVICDASTIGVARGASVSMNPAPIWLEEKAHRSLQSGQCKAALSLHNVFGSTWTKDAGPGPAEFSFTKVIWASFARSGATIRGSLLSPQDGSDDVVGAGQVEECRRTAAGRPIDAVLISIGGNDAGFVGVLEDLVKGDSYYGTAIPPDVRERLDKLLGVGLGPGEKGGIEVDLETLRGAIDNLRRDTPVGDVYINGYPTDLFFIDGPDGQLRFKTCGIFEGVGGLFSISEAEGRLIQERAQLLNDLLLKKAGEFGWHYVDVSRDFAGHGYCRDDSEKMWIGAEDSCRTQGDFEGTMHPNYRGHLATALRYSQALKQHTS